MVWKALDSSRQILKKSGYSIIKQLDAEDVHLFCPVCDSPGLTFSDVTALSTFSCCSACALKWVDVDKERWLSGWRPDTDDVVNEKKRRTARGIQLPFHID